MRECLRKRKFIVTSESDHPFPVDPNLAAKLKPTSVNQLWVADITHIRLQSELVFRAVILDAFSVAPWDGHWGAGRTRN